MGIHLDFLLRELLLRVCNATPHERARANYIGSFAFCNGDCNRPQRQQERHREKEEGKERNRRRLLTSLRAGGRILLRCPSAPIVPPSADRARCRSEASHSGLPWLVARPPLEPLPAAPTTTTTEQGANGSGALEVRQPMLGTTRPPGTLKSLRSGPSAVLAPSPASKGRGILKRPTASNASFSGRRVHTSLRKL